jgi:GNAT superfamily N-acetyltransferase
MSETLIFNYKDPRIQMGGYRSQIDAIFFEATSKKEFKDQKDKEAFNWKYLGFYLAHYPEYAWLAVKDQRVLGYIVGMPFTQDPSLYQIQPHLVPFADLFKTYPGHLHINCHESSRGLGIGKKLVSKLMDQLKHEGVKGLHIMTGANSDNRCFYTKLGFDFQENINTILLMGRLL